MDSVIYVSLGIFFVILIALILIRLKSKKFEIKATDLAVAVLPVVILLLLTGKIQNLEVGELLKIDTVFKEPVVNITSIDDVIDVDAIAEMKNDDEKEPFAIDALFHVCKKYVVLRTDKIPKDKRVQAKQMFRIIEVVRASIVCGEFIGLIVLDDKDRYIGSFDRDFFLETVFPWSKLAGYPAGKSLSDIASWIKSNSIFGLVLEYPEKRIESGEGFRFTVRQNQTIG